MTGPADAVAAGAVADNRGEVTVTADEVDGRAGTVRFADVGTGVGVAAVAGDACCGWLTGAEVIAWAVLGGGAAAQAARNTQPTSMSAGDTRPLQSRCGMTGSLLRVRPATIRRRRMILGRAEA